MGAPRRSYEGQKFGKLLVLRDRPGMIAVYPSGGVHPVALVRCECGVTYRATRQALREGSSQCRSCQLESQRREFSCPCGTREPERYRAKAKSYCVACARRRHRNGACETCDSALYRGNGASVCPKGCPQ